MLLPILNHLFSSIPNPSDQIIKQLNTILFDFLWKGPAKIKSTVVIKQYIDGGLNMVNLKMFMSALKLIWIRRLILKEGNWKHIIEEKLDLKDLINLSTTFIKKQKEKIGNMFWKDVFEAFYNYRIRNKPSKTEVI